jgi:cytochrome P450
MQSKQDSAPTDQGSLGPTGKTSVYDSVLDSKVLPPEEKSLRRLQEEGALLVLAGTDSPAKSLSVIFYHLLANPEIMKRLRTELETLATPDPAWTELEKLPYLSAVIEEGNRLSFGVTARMARISAQYEIYVPSPYANPLPQVSITVEQRNHWALPAGTPMSISTLSAHTNPTIFPNPFAFNPDRWLEDKSLKNHQMAFSKGGRKCLGIELANAELYLVVAALVTKFDKLELYETDEDVVSFVGDFQVAMPKDPRGVRALVG